MKARRIPARAALVLGVGVLSSLGLVVAGFLDHADPSLAGRATLGRVADNAADEVVTRWEHLRRDPAPFVPGPALVWTLVPAPAPQPALDLPARPERVLDALLGEATRLERVERDPARALEVLASVLEKPVEVTGPARRAEARLRAIQIALAAAEPATAHEHWSQAWDELEPRLARGETSYLLLCTLAAAPALTPEERANARTRLAALWDVGELALPAEDAPAGDLALHLAEPAPAAAELLRRLQALVPDAPDASLERLPLAARARAVTAAFGVLEPPPEDGRARLAPSADGAHELLYRRSDPDTAEGVLRPAGATAAALEAGLRADGLLPEEFALDFGGDAADEGTAVHERTPLPGSALAFTLRHADPNRYASAFARRQTLLRAALFVLAALTAAAGISTFRALLRERALAELKSTFIANVSHELRTPIASILLLSENLERDRVEGEAARRRYHGLIRREAERLRALVDDVLDTARLERGEALHLVRASLPAAELARALEQAARERVAAAEGTLAFSTRDLPEHVHVDPEALRRALLNLVENALRHSGSTDLDLTLAGDGRGGLVLGLRDHGRGVPAAARERLFHPFARLEHADAAPGTGLGLAIVREIALGHGGSVRVRGPEDGPGALFELLLPAEGGP